MQKFVVATAVALMLGTGAYAQDNPPPPPADQPATDMGPGMTPPPPPRGGPEHHAPKPPKAGFDIRLGDDNGLKVECGEQPLAQCIEAVQPLIDRLGPPAR